MIPRDFPRIRTQRKHLRVVLCRNLDDHRPRVPSRCLPREKPPFQNIAKYSPGYSRLGLRSGPAVVTFPFPYFILFLNAIRREHMLMQEGPNTGRFLFRVVNFTCQSPAWCGRHACRSFASGLSCGWFCVFYAK
jgi:hypothetical protein